MKSCSRIASLIWLVLLSALFCLGQHRDAELWNRLYRGDTSQFGAGFFYSEKPNALLVRVVRDREELLNPGEALDVGIGQGRNAVFLAANGWRVTGIDISREGLEMAQANAAQLKVKITTLLTGLEEFDYGRERWDLVGGLYMHNIMLCVADKIIESLKPGGLLVIEDFETAPGRHASNKILEAFQELHVIHYEETKSAPDWGLSEVPLVRFVGEKKPRSRPRLRLSSPAGGGGL